MAIKPRAFRWTEQVDTRTAAISWFGYAFIAACLGGFGLWASTAPLVN